MDSTDFCVNNSGHREMMSEIDLADDKSDKSETECNSLPTINNDEENIGESEEIQQLIEKQSNSNAISVNDIEADVRPSPTLSQPIASSSREIVKDVNLSQISKSRVRETPINLPPSPPKFGNQNSPTNSVSSKDSILSRPTSVYSPFPTNSRVQQPYNQPMGPSLNDYSQYGYYSQPRPMAPSGMPPPGLPYFSPYQHPSNGYYHPGQPPMPPYIQPAYPSYNYPPAPQTPVSRPFFRENMNYPYQDYSVPAPMMHPQPRFPRPSRMEFEDFTNQQQFTNTQQFPNNQQLLEWFESYTRWYDRNFQDGLSQRIRRTPTKFDEGVEHSRAVFGPLNQLFIVRGSSVLLYHLEPNLIDVDSGLVISTWPGPLSKEETNRDEVYEFIKGQEGLYQTFGNPNDNEVAYYNSQKLQIWGLLEMLYRQHGKVTGSDIAELLSNYNAKEFAISGKDQPLSRFRRLLTLGQRKNAIEHAMKNNLWSHAMALNDLTLPREVFSQDSPPSSMQNVISNFILTLSSDDPISVLYRYLLYKSSLSQTGRLPYNKKPPVIQNLQHFTILLANDCQVNSAISGAAYTSELLKFIVALQNNDAQYLIAVSPNPAFESDQRKSLKLDYSDELVFMNEILEFSRTSEENIIPLIPYKFLFTCKLFDYGFIVQVRKYCKHLRTLVNHCISLSYEAPSSSTNVNWEYVINIIDELESRLCGHLIGSAASIPQTVTTGVIDKEKVAKQNSDLQYNVTPNDGLVSPSETDGSYSQLAGRFNTCSIADDRTTASIESSPVKSRASPFHEPMLPPPPAPVWTPQSIPEPTSTNPYVPKPVSLSMR